MPDLPACTPEAEGDVAVQELLGFDASLVPDLPLPTTLVCATDVVGEVILFTTSRAVFVAARKMHIPAFAGSELQLVLLGAEHDRVFAWHVRDWARARITDPGHKLDRGTVIGPVAEVLLPQHWPLRRALRRLGLMLSAVHVGDELPAVLTAEGGAP